MKNVFNNYSLERFNNEIIESIKNDAINHIKVFASSDKAKISVVLKASSDKNYFGLHPEFSEDEVINLIRQHGLLTEELFWKELHKKEINQQQFSLKQKMKSKNSFSIDLRDMEKLLFARSVLQMASNFGYRFYCAESTRRRLIEVIRGVWSTQGAGKLYRVEEEIPEDSSTYYCRTGKEGQRTYIEFLGIWPKEIVEKIDSLLQIKRVEKNQTLQIDFIETANKSSEQAYSLLQLYQLSGIKEQQVFDHHFKLRKGEVYYSGVMPRVLSIDYDDHHSSSSDIKYVTLEVGRTTFATVDCMDNPIIMKHPFFNKKVGSRTAYDYLLEFDSYEDRMQANYLYASTHTRKGNTSIQQQRNYEKQQIDIINQYLKHSFNTHTVAVSANIETADDYLVVAKRGNKTIDEGEYYCSANGQSEFNDKNVSFYTKSVYEDLPTLSYDSDTRLDLNNEIQREAIAELGISMYEQDWHYYGISFLSINTMDNALNADGQRLEETARVTKRRMHFNVLTFNKAYQNFETVYNNQENVTEKFENSYIKGIRLSVFSDLKMLMMNFVENFATFAYNHSGAISLFIVILPIVINLLHRIQMPDTSMPLENRFEIAAVILYIFIFMMKWLSKSEIRRKRNSVYINKKYLYKKYISKSNNNLLEKVFKKVEKKNLEENYHMHAILKVMLGLYFLQKSSEAE